MSTTVSKTRDEKGYETMKSWVAIMLTYKR
jgi:hypothetical protein